MNEADRLEFQSTLDRPEGTGTWTFLPIPIDLKAHYGAAGQIKVRGSIDGEPFRSTALPRGDGTHYLVVKGEIRKRINATAGSVVAVILERDLDERTVAVPVDFLKVLSSQQSARSAFDGFSYSHRKEYVDWIESAKTEATRAKRIQSALGMIAGNSSPKRRPRS
jgi:bacteriocin resistance YdeI/OmpD-like protein/uncharacterized protein DUF1905